MSEEDLCKTCWHQMHGSICYRKPPNAEKVIACVFYKFDDGYLEDWEK